MSMQISDKTVKSQDKVLYFIFSYFLYKTMNIFCSYSNFQKSNILYDFIFNFNSVKILCSFSFASSKNKTTT